MGIWRLGFGGHEIGIWLVKEGFDDVHIVRTVINISVWLCFPDFGPCCTLPPILLSSSFDGRCISTILARTLCLTVRDAQWRGRYEVVKSPKRLSISTASDLRRHPNLDCW